MFVNLLSKRRGRQKPCYLEGFFTFPAKTSSLGNVHKHGKSQCFCPTKTAKTVTQTAPKSQNLAPRPPNKAHDYNNAGLKTENRRPKVLKTTHVSLIFLLPVPGGRVHELYSQIRAVKKQFFFETRRRDLSKTHCSHKNTR